MRFIFLLASLVSGAIAAAPQVTFETTMGQFVVELNTDKAPTTSANFLKYAEQGRYEGTVFHRIIAGFMAQGGGFDTELNKVPTDAPIINEASNGLKNKVATIAMARTSDPDSATNQFFINYADNHFLDYSAKNPGYAVFGKVTQGFEVIEAMAKQPTRSLGHYHDVPATAIVINKVSIQK